MKANKALKRLAKIEVLISDVTERYSSTPHIREVLQDAKAAVTRAKKAVSLQASSGTAKNSPMKHSKPPSKPTPEEPKAKRRISKEGMARIIAATKKRWAAVRAAKAQGAAKKAAPAKKKVAAQKAPAKAGKKAAKRATTRKAPAKAAAAPTVAEAGAQ